MAPKMINLDACTEMLHASMRYSEKRHVTDSDEMAAALILAGAALASPSLDLDVVEEAFRRVRQFIAVQKIAAQLGPPRRPLPSEDD